MRFAEDGDIDMKVATHARAVISCWAFGHLYAVPLPRISGGPRKRFVRPAECRIAGAMPRSVVVEGFGCLPCATVRLAEGQASGSLPGRKPRSAGSRSGVWARYGDYGGAQGVQGARTRRRSVGAGSKTCSALSTLRLGHAPAAAIVALRVLRGARGASGLTAERAGLQVRMKPAGGVWLMRCRSRWASASPSGERDRAGRSR